MIDPVSIGLMGVDAVTSFINMKRGKEDMARIEQDLGAMGDAPNYTLSSDYDRMVNMALNTPQTGVAAAERGYGDQAAAAAMYGSRGLGSLGAATRQQADTLNALEAQRLGNVQNALGTRAGADQSVMNANVARAQNMYDAERARLLQEKAGAQDAINAGISGFTNLGGGLLSGLAGGLSSNSTFGAGLESFLNPAAGSLSSADSAELAAYRKALGQKDGGRVGKNGFITPGVEDHDKNEFAIVNLKTGSVDGISTGRELHQENEDGTASVTNSKQNESLHDGYKKWKKGNWKAAWRAMKEVFESPQFNR